MERCLSDTLRLFEKKKKNVSMGTVFTSTFWKNEDPFVTIGKGFLVGELGDSQCSCNSPITQNLNHLCRVYMVLYIWGFVCFAQVRHQVLSHWMSKLDVGVFG